MPKSVLCAASLSLLMLPAAMAQDLTLVSVPEDPLVLGVQGDGDSRYCSLSGDGRLVVFESDARQLVAGDNNARADIFLRDRIGGTTLRLSVASNGSGLPEGARTPIINADGRYVAFVSDDDTLTGVVGSLSQVFVLDLQTRVISLASRNTSGQPSTGSGGVNVGSFSRNGRNLVFSSDRNDHVVGDTNNLLDLFVFDQLTGVVTRASTDAAGNQANGISPPQAFLSADGARLAFESDASNLVAGDTNGARDVFLKVLATGDIQRVSLNSAGFQIGGGSDALGISGDGRSVLFNSAANSIVIPDTNNLYDIFVRRTNGAGNTIRVSVDGNGVAANVGITDAVIDASGDQVLMSSTADNWITNPAIPRMYLKNLATGALSVVLEAVDGNNFLQPNISADGQVYCAGTAEPRLVAGDINLSHDIVTRDSGLVAQLASVASAPVPQTVGDQGSRLPDQSSNGQYAVFLSSAKFLDAGSAGIGPRNDEVILANIPTGEITWLTFPAVISTIAQSAAAVGSGYSDSPAISANGNFIAYVSTRDDLVSPILGNTSRLRPFLRSRVSGNTIRLGDFNARLPRVDNTGRVIFESADAVIAADTNGLADIYLFQAPAGLVRVSSTVSGAQPTGPSTAPDLAATAQIAVFVSTASNLLSTPTSTVGHVYRRDLGTGVTTLISKRTDTGAEGNQRSFGPRVSGDGRFVAFISRASNLVDGDTNAQADVFVFDAQNNTLVRASANLPAPIEVTDFSLVRIASDGSHILFSAESDVPYLLRNAVGTTVLETMVDNALLNGAYQSRDFSISAGGHQILFDTEARLLAADNNGSEDVYRLALGSALFASGFEP